MLGKIEFHFCKLIDRENFIFCEISLFERIAVPLYKFYESDDTRNTY